MRPPHPRGKKAECPRQESNLVLDLRGVACRPSHAEGISEADGRTRTGMNLLTRQGPHRSATSAEAGAQGFEPCPRVLEARCSPRSTPLKVSPARLARHRRLRRGRGEGVRRGLNPSPRAPRARVLPLHHGHHRSVVESTGSRRSGRGGSRTRKAHRSPALQAGPVSDRVAFRIFGSSGRCRGRTCGLQRVMLVLWPAELTARLFQHPDQDSNPGLLVRSEA